MNLLQVQDSLKNASDQQLALEMRNPTGLAPQYLVLSELTRRNTMRASYGQPPPQASIAEIESSKAGIGAFQQAPQMQGPSPADAQPAPQQQGIPQPQSMPQPQQPMPTAPRAQPGFATGGLVAFAEGGDVARDYYGSFYPSGNSMDSYMDPAELARRRAIAGALSEKPQVVNPPSYYTPGSRPVPNVDPENGVNPRYTGSGIGNANINVPASLAVTDREEPAGGMDGMPSGVGPAPVTEAPPANQYATGIASLMAGQQGMPPAPNYDTMRQNLGKVFGEDPRPPRVPTTQEAVAEWAQNPNMPKSEARLAEMDRKAKGDRSENVGTALMRAGFGMMASKSPYLFTAAGEGGISGLDAYTQGQKELNKADMERASMQTNLEKAHKEVEKGNLDRAQKAKEAADKNLENYHGRMERGMQYMEQTRHNMASESLTGQQVKYQGIAALSQAQSSAATAQYAQAHADQLRSAQPMELIALHKRIEPNFQGTDGDRLLDMKRKLNPTADIGGNVRQITALIQARAKASFDPKAVADIDRQLASLGYLGSADTNAHDFTQ